MYAIGPRAKADPTVVPAMATPRVVPVCRPAETSEVATPGHRAGHSGHRRVGDRRVDGAQEDAEQQIGREHGRPASRPPSRERASSVAGKVPSGPPASTSRKEASMASPRWFPFDDEE